MVMQLENVVPFGRSLDEYRAMFELSEGDLEKRIVGLGDGPASFNAEMNARGKRMLSIDPLYVFGASDIERQFDIVIGNIIAQVNATPNDWVWSYHRSPDHLREARVDVFKRFIADYESGRNDGRYLVGELPQLAFENGQFDLALCSHFLFLYSAHLSYEFHRAAVFEMLRVAWEVRIFPLLTLMLEPSPYLEPLLTELESQGYTAQVHTVDYEIQRGGNKMLRIAKTLGN